MMLVLFDVDKTLFLNSDPLMGRATTDAIETVWGLKLPGDAIRRANHPGQTAMHIARELLRGEGLDDDAIDSGLARWCEEASRRYLELLAEADYGRVAGCARPAQRRPLSARSIWRSASRLAISRRLSRCSLPRARASSILTRPFLN
jgi:phosphoglycolate phosphatase-like HAD superfamily hydrolase